MRKWILHNVPAINKQADGRTDVQMDRRTVGYFVTTLERFGLVSTSVCANQPTGRPPWKKQWEQNVWMLALKQVQGLFFTFLFY